MLHPNRIPPNGTTVYHGQRRGRVSRTGHPPAGVVIEVQFDDDGSTAWYPATELTDEPAEPQPRTKPK